jgi:hypothetical protein
MAAHKSRIVRCEYTGEVEGHEYRGADIRLDTSVPTTYYGRYKIGINGFTTLGEAKAFIDAKRDKVAA